MAPARASLPRASSPLRPDLWRAPSTRESLGNSRVSLEVPSEATVLGFDFGTRRIGVAVGNTLLRMARPLTTIDAPANADRFAAIAAIVAEWQPQRLVVGIPVHADGAAHEMTARARRFARQLQGRFHLPVTEVDERYTTEVADARLKEERAGRAARAARDEIAAETILQGYLDAIPVR